MTPTVKGILATLATAAVLGTAALLWSGVETELGDIPAITAMRIEIEKLKAADLQQANTNTEFREVHGTIRTDVAVNGARGEQAITGLNQLRGAILNQ